MNIPQGLKFTKEHEWIKVDGDKAWIGISDHAQDELGDIVFLELPEVGQKLAKGDRLAVVESVKAVSDIYAPMDGEILEVNMDLEASPEQINEDAYESWIVVISISDSSQVGELMTADEYQAFLEEEA